MVSFLGFPSRPKGRIVAMQAVIVSFDSLAATSLGCFGNEWIETPNWDRLAATGAVFDNHFVDTVSSLAGLAWATGRPAMRANDVSPSPCLGALLRANGIRSRLIAAGAVQDWQRHFQFDGMQHVDGREGFDAKPDQTPFAEVVKQAITERADGEDAHAHELLWLHAPGPGAPPEGFDALYFEDFDERGQQTAELTDAERACHPAVYAGSVSLMDHWLGELLKHLDEQASSEPMLVIVMAAKGAIWKPVRASRANASQSLAEVLGDQVARTPLVLRVQRDPRFGDLICVRSDRLVQTCDLMPTLLDWFQVPQDPSSIQLAGQSWLREVLDEVPPREDLAYGDGADLVAVRTPEWLCISQRHVGQQGDEQGNESVAEGASSRVALYVKPEDLWDINDISSQQSEVVAELLTRLGRPS
ncbi:sulfatase-like hydrolase/transferase [Schlesneria sp. T3-172]|uniref:sulfatase-like hydrolase/transferase n=1 Tax=Schlesneria sphaerica TaxID=3373610 RepID=UPI0037CA0B69